MFREHKGARFSVFSEVLKMEAALDAMRQPAGSDAQLARMNDALTRQVRPQIVHSLQQY